MHRRGLLVILALVALPAATARAAPPVESVGDEEGDTICEASLDEAKLITGRDLYARGQEHFDEGDFFSAITMWEQVLVLMPERQASLGVNLAHAHRRAYAVDADAGHLRSAHTLFTDQLSSLDADDDAREVLEGEIAEIEAELSDIAENQAQAQAQREEEVRQEQIRLNQLILAQAEVKHQRSIQKIYYGVGGSMTGLGVGSLAAMTAFLALGAGLDSQGQTTANSTDVPQNTYSDLLVQGAAYNRGAISTGVIGGVLVVSGASLLIMAAVGHNRMISPAKDTQASLTPGLGGLQLNF